MKISWPLNSSNIPIRKLEWLIFEGTKLVQINLVLDFDLNKTHEGWQFKSLEALADAMRALKNWEYFLVKTFDEYLLQKYLCIMFFSFFRLALEGVDGPTLATNQEQILVATIKAMEPTQSKYWFPALLGLLK